MLIKKPLDLLSILESTYSDLKCRNDVTICDLRNKIQEKKIFLNFNDSTNDLFLNAFRKCSNINTIFIFGKNQDVAYRDFYLPKYKNDYILYGIRNVTLTKWNVIKAFYQLHYYRHQKRHIQDYLNYIEAYLDGYDHFQDASDDTLIQISILIVSKRHSVIDFYSIKEEIQPDSMIYIPENRESQWIAATLFFNKNSLDFLDKQDLKFYLKGENKKCWEKMNDFLTFVYQVVPIEERHRTLFYSSTILYFLGHRLNNDFDFMIFCKEENPDFHAPLRAFQLRENKADEDAGEKGKYDFSYIHTQDSSLRIGYYEEFYDKWAQMYGVRKFEEIYTFGKDHMYFLGMKSTILPQDIIRRQMRNRPRAIADLIALRKRYGFKIDIPKPPRSVEKFYPMDKISDDEKNGGEKKKKIVLLKSK